MNQPRTQISVNGTTRQGQDGPLLVLDERLDGHDTFLSGLLDLGSGPAPVQIITLDDVTVLRQKAPVNTPDGTWSGTLHLPRGIRPRRIPEDLAEAAQNSNRNLDALDSAELRYALTFLNEASTESIRAARIVVIVAALPQHRSEAK
ncbi:hypothetical protein [Glycomyces sp. MUSA5-2]|uniref:hypothetical protein n=1 Tax=Glycomyces sp. MUSA5-2 TaxID=2053002 RepID=UPI0030086A9D